MGEEPGKALVNLKPGADEERRCLIARLGEKFISFSRSHQAYYQVCYIDERGSEVEEEIGQARNTMNEVFAGYVTARSPGHGHEAGQT